MKTLLLASIFFIGTAYGMGHHMKAQQQMQQITQLSRTIEAALPGSTLAGSSVGSSLSTDESVREREKQQWQKHDASESEMSPSRLKNHHSSYLDRFENLQENDPRKSQQHH